MRLRFERNSLRNISIILITLIAAVYCCGVDLSYDAFSVGGSIKGNASVDISRSLIATVPAAVNESTGRNSGNQQDLEKANASSDLLISIARKLEAARGCDPLSDTIRYSKYYLISVCVSCLAYLFLLISIRFIHLKDGSK